MHEPVPTGLLRCQSLKLAAAAPEVGTYALRTVEVEP